MCVWFKGSSGERTCWSHKIKRKRNWRRMQRESDEVQNGAISRNVGSITDARECTLHGTRIFNFLHVHFPCTQRNFIIKTFQRSGTKYLIASGKLLEVTVQESDGAPTTGNRQIICSKVKRITVVQKRYFKTE